MEANGTLLYRLAMMFTLQLAVIGIKASMHGSVVGNMTQDFKETPSVNQHHDNSNVILTLGNLHTNSSVERDSPIIQETSLQNRSVSYDIYKERYEKIVACLHKKMCHYIPNSYIVYINFGLSVQLTIVNVLVVCIFLQKKNRSPVTILLSSLAISDVLSAVTTSIPHFIGTTFFNMHIIKNIWSPNYPLCKVIMYFQYANFNFHLASVCLTAVLSAQKAIAVLFPFWSKSHINNTVCVVISVFIFGIVLCFVVANWVKYDLHLEIRTDMCYFDKTINVNVWIVRISYLVSVSVVLVSTAILCYKLTCRSTNLPRNDSLAVRRRNRISAILVVLISVIFLLSEGISIVIDVHLFLNRIGLDSYNYDYHYFIKSSSNFQSFSWMIGYCLNFIVYLVMGKKLRSTLAMGCSKMCNTFCCYN